MSMFRKAYSVFGALLMLQFLLQLYFIAGAIFTIVNANDNAKDVYVAFKNADRFASLHVANGYLIGFTILIMVALSFASRYPWRTTITTAVLWVLVAVQSGLAHTPLAAIAALHGINALLIIGLGGYLTGTNWAFGSRASPKGPSRRPRGTLKQRRPGATNTKTVGHLQKQVVSS